MRGVTKDKGESSKANKKEYARVAYNYSKDESPREVTKVKIPKDRKSFWDP